MARTLIVDKNRWIKLFFLEYEESTQEHLTRLDELLRAYEADHRAKIESWRKKIDLHEEILSNRRLELLKEKDRVIKLYNEALLAGDVEARNSAFELWMKTSEYELLSTAKKALCAENPCNIKQDCLVDGTREHRIKQGTSYGFFECPFKDFLKLAVKARKSLEEAFKIEPSADGFAMKYDRYSNDAYGDVVPAFLVNGSYKRRYMGRHVHVGNGNVYEMIATVKEDQVPLEES